VEESNSVPGDVRNPLGGRARWVSLQVTADVDPASKTVDGVHIFA
jgi:hypothetical protein